MSKMLEDAPEISIGQPYRAELSAERAASAAEAASQAAQSAASTVERLGGWLALLASRAPQAVIPEAALAAPPEQEHGRMGKGVAETIKRTAKTMGQRLSDLSEGHYGLETQPPKAKTKLGKKAAKRLERQAREAAKAEQPGAEMSLFPWAVGLSLGLVIGLAGVAYWQRRRLQAMWGQTSHRMQQTTEHMRQRLEASRARPQTIQSDIPAATPGFTPLGSAAPAADQPINGRKETSLP